MRATDVVLVDPQPIFRAGVRGVLEETGRYRVVAQAGTGPQASKLCEAPDFDLMVLNVQLPVMTGIQVAKLLSRRQATPRIVFLSNEHDSATVTAASRAGAVAFLPRDTPSADLVRVLDRVVAGETVLPETLTTNPALKRSRRLGAPNASEPAGDDRLHLLSVLEVQVLTQVAEGFSIPEIAASLAAPEDVVAEYQSSVLRKLDVDDQAQAVRHAQRYGWIPSIPPDFGPVSASSL